MPKSNWNFLTIVGIVTCLLVLVCIRLFQNKLFYDPLIPFFKGEFQQKSLPNFDSTKLFFSISFRYILNTLISLGLIYLIFKEIKLVKFSMVLFGIAFLILLVLFSMLILSKSENYFLLFNIRRFLMQPLLVLLFIPAFYYQKLLNTK